MSVGAVAAGYAFFTHSRLPQRFTNTLSVFMLTWRAYHLADWWDRRWTVIQIQQDQSASEFLQLAGPLLYRQEATNSLMLGLCENMKAASPEKAPVLLRAVEGDLLLSAAIQTPPMNLVLTHGSTEALEKIAHFLFAHSVSFPGVVGPSEASEAFARIWGSLTGKKCTLGMGQKIYKLSEVIFPPKIDGEFRAANESDADLIEQWAVKFTQESLPDSDMRGLEFWRSYAKRAAIQGTAHFWSISGKPVAVAHVGRPTRNGISINGVYTPLENRRRGYASAVVAHLSQKMLDAGKTFCVLYTDLANPTSNKIYQTMGYREVATSKHFIFGVEP